MTDRLTDEKVSRYVDMGNYPATSCANDDTIALAREVQEWRTRRCDGCCWWKPATGECVEPNVYAGTGYCSIYTPADHACNAWTPKAGQ